MTRFLLFLCLGIMLVSCSGGGPFRSQTPLQRYAQKLTDAGLRETSLGEAWFRAYDSSLSAPEPVSLPYRQAGYFADDEPRAVTIAFSAGRGSGLRLSVEQRSTGVFRLYTELWKQERDGQYRLLHAFDSAQRAYNFEADQEEQFLLRLQPELLHKGEYAVSISVGPSLAFPVPRGRIGSVWGDDRDGGVRRHEGIDIFAPRRTPVVASAAGTVGRVEETRRGGKVVWIRPDKRPINLYYAHLEEQLVKPGDRVSVGDTIGLVGTTGNAKGTPPHLHFGIYARGGATNPKPFVDPEWKRPEEVYTSLVGTWQRVRRETNKLDRGLPAGSVVWVTDVEREFAHATTPGLQKVKVAPGNLQKIDNQLVIAESDQVVLFDAPYPDAARQRTLSKGDQIKLLGYWEDFALVRHENREGWLLRSALR